MRKIQILSLLALSLTLSTAPAAKADDLFHLTLSARVPATAADCATEAQEIATKIMQSSNDIKSAQGKCIVRGHLLENGQSYTIDSLYVEYAATNYIYPYTVQWPTEDYSGDVLYPSYRSCLDDLSYQKALYAQSTGINPFVASCLSRGEADRGFQMTVQGIGAPKKRIRQFKNGAFVKASSNQAWQAEILKMIAAQGGTFVKRNNEFFYYYGDESSFLSSSTAISTGNAAECESQRAEALNMLTKLGAKNSVALCHGDAQQSANLDLLADINSIPFGMERSDDQFYFSFEECMGARAALAARYKSDDTYPYHVGFFCAPYLMNRAQYEIYSFLRN